MEGVQWYKCNSPEECSKIFHKGEINRNTECTKMNAHSSRSHAILIMKIEKSIKITNPKNIKNLKNIDRLLTCSYLHLVDLAGSERVRKTGATDMRLEEAKKINLSLLCLGNVISSLTNPNTAHISYRDSKLTRLLKESLGGNAKTSLIVTVSPSSFNTEETMSSLYFALRAMKVQNRPIINKTIDYQALCVKLQDDLDKLNDDYAKLKMEYDKVVEELEKYKKGEQYLELQKKIGINPELSIQLSSSEKNDDSNSNLININNSNSTNSNSTNSNTITTNPTLEINNEPKNNNKNNLNKNKINNIYITGNKNNINNNFYNNNDLSKENTNISINYSSKNKIQKLKEFYENLMKNKSEEYENILKKVDDVLYKKENEIEKLNAQINELNNKIRKQKEDLDDMSKEKEDLQNSVATLSSQGEEQKNLLKNDKTEKEYKALIEILNDNISALEKKIIKLEDTSIFSETSKEKIINSLDFKVNEFQSQINNLTQKKNNSMVKKAQNEIKINLISSEKNIDFKSNDKKNEEISKIQKENFDLLVDQETITKKVEIIEAQIKTTKKLNKNLKSILDKYNKKNKADLIMSLAKKEIDNIILNDCIKAYDNILINVIESQHDDKFNLYKVENDLNNIINKTSLLLNNYLNHINKLDEINKELDTIVNEPDNYNKLNQMRENIELLIEESEEINNITKDISCYNSRNINNISYDKCPHCLENIITNMSENFLILIETYNMTNSNICQLLSIMEESYCYKKKFVTNLCSFIQENVKDAFTKQNIMYKLNQLLKAKIEEKDYNNKIEEIIRELFKKLTLKLIEKDKENNKLNQSVTLYMKQIDENVKKSNLINNNSNNFKKCNTNRNNLTISDNEINKLKLKVITQQKTISNTKNSLDKINTSFNKVNELLQSTNFNNSSIDASKITNALAECKNVVQNISKGLNMETNNIKNKSKKVISLNKKNNSNKNINMNIKDVLRQSMQKDNLINVKNLKDKKLPQKIFKEYFINLSKFSKTMIDYSLKDDNENIEI